MRALGAIPGNRHVDEPRVHLPQFFVAETVLLRRTGPEVLAEDVGPCDELAEDFAAFRGLQVQGDALYAAVVGLEIGAGHAGEHGRAARIVADLGHLDLDDLGAEIGHQHVGHRAGLRRRAGDDFDAVEGAVWLCHRRRPYAAPTGSLRRKPVRCAAPAAIKAASWPPRTKRAPISI